MVWRCPDTSHTIPFQKISNSTLVNAVALSETTTSGNLNDAHYLHNSSIVAVDIDELVI